MALVVDVIGAPGGRVLIVGRRVRADRNDRFACAPSTLGSAPIIGDRFIDAYARALEEHVRLEGEVR